MREAASAWEKCKPLWDEHHPTLVKLVTMLYSEENPKET